MEDNKEVKKRKTTTKKNSVSKKNTVSKNSKKTTSNSKNKKSSSEVNSTKNVSSKENKSNNKKKSEEKDKGLIILNVVFFSLIVLVIVLFIMVFNKKSEMKNTLVADMIFPVIEENAIIPFSVSLNNVSEDKEYIFKVTNYRGDKVNDSEINYKIIIENPSGAKIKVFRGKGNNDLMVDQKHTEIDDLKMYKDVKEDVYFRISFDNLEAVKDKEMISISIVS